MTGIEKLREFTEARPSLLTCDQIEELRDISAQIAREHAEDCYRMGLDYGTVLSVAADMERHFPCVERGEESDVERWSRELRGALGGRAQGHAADVSMNAYDLLPEEDREAIAWVREHGGLDAVDAIWDNDVPLAEAVISELWPDGRPDECGNDDVMGELRRRLMPEGCDGEFLRLHMSNLWSFMFGVMDCLGVDKSDSDAPEIAFDALDRRLMPEGMEWLIEAWPKFEDDAPVKLGDMALIDGYADMVEAVQIWIHGKPVIYGDNGSQQLEKGEPVRRPESKCRDCAHWQKDPTADKMGVCWFFYHEHEGQDCYVARRADIGACEEFMPRAGALAGDA